MTLQYHKKNFPKEKSPANGHQKITTGPMTENSGGPAKTAHARPLPSLCPPFARAHCSAPFHSAPQLRGSQRSRSANRQFFPKSFRGSAAKSRLQQHKERFQTVLKLTFSQERFFTGNKFPQKTATGSVRESVGGGSSSREKHSFLRKTVVSKKTQCFAQEKFAKAAKFFSRPKPTSKVNAHRRFFKRQKFFTIFNLNWHKPNKMFTSCKILPHGRYKAT